MNEGSYEATIKDGKTSRIITKTRSELSSQNKANLTLNVEVMNILYNALDANKSIRVKRCKTAKEI